MTLKALGDTAKFINGAAFKPTDWEDMGLPIIRIQNLTGTSDKFNFTTRKVKQELIVEPGDLLVSWSATLDVYRWSGPRGLLNQHIFKVLPNSDIDPDYLFYVLRNALAELSSKTHGSTMKHVVRGDFESTQVFIPSLREQHRIVDLLSRAEGIVRLRREAEKKTAELVPALFIDMFGDPARNEKGWDIATIASLASVQTGATPSRVNPAYYADAEIPWIKTGEVNGGVILDSEERISQVALAETNCKVFPIGTILIAMYGQGQTRGRCAVLGMPAASNQACAAILPSEKIDVTYLFCFLKTQYKQLRGMARGGNQANLNLSMIKSLPIISPPLSAQQAFTEKLNSISSIQIQQSAATEKAQAAFEALLAGVFKD